MSLSDTVTPDLGSEIIERSKSRIGVRIHHCDSCFESIHQKDSFTDSFCSSILLIGYTVGESFISDSMNHLLNRFVRNHQFEVCIVFSSILTKFHLFVLRIFCLFERIYQLISTFTLMCWFSPRSKLTGNACYNSISFTQSQNKTKACLKIATLQTLCIFFRKCYSSLNIRNS